jgi:hypothetical protein
MECLKEMDHKPVETISYFDDTDIWKNIWINRISRMYQ